MDDITLNAPSKDDCNLAVLAHLLGIFTSFAGPLVLWLVKREESPFVAQQAKEALNFQITIMIGNVIAFVLSFLLIGIVFFPALYVLNVVFSILAAVATSKGQAYRYPYSLRLVN